MSNETNQPQSDKASIAEKLGQVKLGVRKDIIVSRTVFRDRASYIVHDPLSFQSQMFSQADYEVFSSLDRDKTLSQIFARLVETDKLESSDEQGFYEFVLQLQLKGLLDLPVTNGNALYKRFQMRQAAAKKPSMMKLIFFKIGLLNPNQFLDRTVRLFRPLFTRAFFVFWCLLMLASGGVLLARWGEFWGPLSGIFAYKNLLIIAVVMTVLKVIHEFGHAYACKVFGGAVPDMGALFIASLPLAYVDVSSSWSFPSRRNRIIVALGGMYFETIIAAIAVFVWATTGTGLVNSVAHFTVLMASFTTMLFNANPLMKFDGYYVLSDLLGIPNLRAKSTQALKDVSKRTLLGLNPPRRNSSRREYTWLVLFGIASSLYSVVLILSISFMIAAKFLLLGIAMGALFIGSLLISLTKQVFSYLWTSPECASVRPRAVALSVVLAVGVPLLLAFCPIPGGTVTVGQTGFEQQHAIRVSQDCYVEKVVADANSNVSSGQVLVKLRNDEIKSDFQLASAKLNLAKVKFRAAQTLGPSALRAEYTGVESAEAELDTVSKRATMLEATAPFKGKLASCIPHGNEGLYLPVGTEIAKVVAGRPIVNVLVDGEQLRGTMPKVGQKVKCRVATHANQTLEGTITKIEGAGSRVVEETGLTHLSSGNILINPNNNEADQPYFRFEVLLDDANSMNIPVNTTAKVQLVPRYESVGHYLMRRTRVFFNKLTTQ